MSAFTPAPTLVHGALTPFPIMCLTVGAATLLEVVDQYEVLDNLFGPSEGLVVDFVASGEDEASELAELVGYPGAPSDLQGHWLVLECAMPHCETELETLAYASAIAPLASFESYGRKMSPGKPLSFSRLASRGCPCWSRLGCSQAPSARLSVPTRPCSTSWAWPRMR
ncbi:hypothetical protein [Halomonas sp. E19]|uniref:hypothetical protein n=1 Tax=Halomonas sp. E19 TaxID=3397247 RepID=UPI004033C72F